MGVHRQDQHPELIRMAIAALVAVASVTALLLLDFVPNNSQGNADGMITSAVLSRAGAINALREADRYLRPRND